MLDKIWKDLGGNASDRQIVTKTKQLRVTNILENNNKIFSPIIYQSCMNPEDIRIYEMKIVKCSHFLWMIETHYEKVELDVRNFQLDVSDWEAKIHKVDCKKCENCGRCGW